MRRLQLNWPVNYLAAILLRAEHPHGNLLAAMRSQWTGLGNDRTRAQAIHGAQYLELLDDQTQLTPLGAAAVQVLDGLGVSVHAAQELRRNPRLAEYKPPLAALLRIILLQRPEVQLIIDSLRAGPRNAIELWHEARSRNEGLARHVFLDDPGLAIAAGGPLQATVFCATTVHKVHQILYHAGILKTRYHRTAYRDMASYQPQNDCWALDRAMMLSPRPTPVEELLSRPARRPAR